MREIIKYSITVAVVAILASLALTPGANAQVWEQTNGPYGGRVYALAINSSGDIFAGAVGGGVFRSTDNGDNWTVVNNGLSDHRVWSLAINAEDLIIAGTVSGGIFRSFDDGNNWLQQSGPLWSNVECLVAHLQSEWVIMGCFSYRLEHTGQDLQAKILFIA